MKKLTIYLVAFIVTNIISSCDREEPLPPVTNPQQAILGKWEVIENTFGPISYPGSYQEFRPDSIVFNYNNKNDFSYGEYWFADSLWVDGSLWYTDSLLYIKHTYIDQANGDTILVDIQPYQYNFINYNKLKLAMVYPALNPTHIYQRIK